ncbi:UbiA family prenyltransferase [Pollutibacter soli]|uniref:UbiA family prenyltransferase n=1 Tax=Pollutibacter soli TaxID=3034157 RepID=UPI0030133495
MNIRSALRAGEWWEYKLVPILTVGYMTALKAGNNLLPTSLWIVFVFFSLIVGASYVSLINDITDIEEDRAAGKKNRMAAMKPAVRLVFPAMMVLSGVGFGYFYSAHLLSVLLYLASWIVFSCYSIPPVRLKTRGIWGVFADGTASQFFPSLLMVSFISFKTGQPVNFMWFCAVGGWSFALGLRGILWHQFHDLQNDKKIGINTFAVRTNESTIRLLGRLLIMIELVSLFLMLYYFNAMLPLIALALYLINIAVTYRLRRITQVIIKPSGFEEYRIFMSEFYIVFLPLSVLIDAGIQYPGNWIILAIHLILFPANLYKTIANGIGIIQSVLIKLKPGRN